MPDSPSAKLSPQAVQLLSEQSGDVEGDSRVECLIQVRPDAVDGAREWLEGHGTSVTTQAGDVFTASAPLSALQTLAELDEVVYIEVSTPLYGESPPTE